MFLGGCGDGGGGGVGRGGGWGLSKMDGRLTAGAGNYCNYHHLCVKLEKT